MSQLTRCPNCATTFRVSEAQMALRDGRVRCGHCSFVFNARACQVDADPVTIIDLGAEHAAGEYDPFWDEVPAGNAQASGTSDLESTNRPAGDPAPATVTTPPPALAAGETVLPRTHEQWVEQLDELPPPSWLRAPSADEAVPSATSSDLPEPGLADDSSPVPSDSTGDDADGAMSTTRTAPAEEEPLADWQPAHATPTGDGGAPAVDRNWLQPAGLSPWRWAWRLANVLALGSAILLAAVLLRQPLIELYPSSRPLLSQACQLLRCQVRAPQNFAHLFLDGIEFSFDPDDPKRLELNAVLRNVAPYAQQWPVIDVELQDKYGKPVARRLLQPAHYLPAGEKAQAEFGPEQEVQLNVAMRLHGISVENYSVGFWRAP